MLHIGFYRHELKSKVYSNKELQKDIHKALPTRTQK